jgi:hypothetical protein
MGFGNKVNFANEDARHSSARRFQYFGNLIFKFFARDSADHVQRNFAFVASLDKPKSAVHVPAPFDFDLPAFRKVVRVGCRVKSDPVSLVVGVVGYPFDQDNSKACGLFYSPFRKYFLQVKRRVMFSAFGESK